VLGRTSDTVNVPGDLRLSSDSSSLSILGDQFNPDQTVLRVYHGLTKIRELRFVPFSGGSLSVCYIPTIDDDEKLSACSSSLRYKTNVATFTQGLEVVRRLRPIAFNWKAGGMHDVGFGAEEVEKVEPLLVTYNRKGEIEGVKYGQLTTVLVNAVNAQQDLITKQEQQLKQQQSVLLKQQRQLDQQQQQLEALRKLVCQSNPQAEVCK